MPQYSHWHYIGGYLIGTSLHNWPVMVALAISGNSAWRLYRTATRRNVCWLYGWCLLVFVYEYVKHLGQYLAEPVGFLWTTDWAWMQPAGYFIVECLIPFLILALALLLLFKALSESRPAPPANQSSSSSNRRLERTHRHHRPTDEQGNQ